MPITSINPFNDPTTTLKKGINPFMEKVVEESKSETTNILFGPQLINIAGNWRTKFSNIPQDGNDAELILEIGSHKGDVINKMAFDHPNTCFIGMDITFKRVYTTAFRAKKNNINNVASILANASTIDRLFMKDELSGVVIFFPDPWVGKKKMTKKRLINEDFARKTFHCIKDSGFLWLKTDHEPYFNDASNYLKKAGFIPYLNEDGLTSKTYTSAFETIFNSLFKPTFEGKWIKPPRKSDASPSSFFMQ